MCNSAEKAFKLKASKSSLSAAVKRSEVNARAHPWPHPVPAGAVGSLKTVETRPRVKDGETSAGNTYHDHLPAAGARAEKRSAASRACPARKSRTRVDCARISRILAICPILNPRCHYGSVLDVVGGLPTIQCQDISCFSLRLPRFGEIGRSLAKN